TDESTQFIRNTIDLHNKSNTAQTVEIHIDAPSGFPSISTAQYQLELKAGDSAKIPFTLSKLRNAEAGQSLCRIIVNNQGSYMQRDFVIVNKEIKYIKVVPMNNTFTIDDNTKSIPLALKLKNLGNKSNTFSILINDPFFAIDKTWTITLQPLQDTLFRFDYVFTKYVMKEIDNRRIAVSVTNGENAIPYFFYISKVQSNNYQHATPYEAIPLSVETGAFVFGNTINAYWGANTQFALNKNTDLDLIYRSKTFGIGGVQYDYFLASLRYKKMTMSVGQMSDIKEFLATGLGASVTYAKSDSQNITVTGISDKMSSYQTSLSKEIAVNANYRLFNKNFNSYAVTIDNLSLNKKSNIWINNARILDKQDLQLNATLGVGNSSDSITSMNTFGYRYGYQFMIKQPNWSLRSNALVNTNDLPGIYQGWRSFNDYLNYSISKSLMLEAYYSQNYTRQTVASDSLYRYNEMLYNQTSFGVSGYLTVQRSVFRLGIGREKSFGTFSNILTPEYYTFNYGANFPISDWGKVNITGSYNYLPATNSEFKSTKFATVFGGITSKYVGINGFYMVRPLFDSSQNGPDAAYLTTSYQITPFVNIKLWRDKLNCRVQYGYYGLKTKDATSSTTNLLMGFITYNNPKKGIEFSINGSYYIKSTFYIPNTVSFTLRKTIGVPIITKRKYYDMNITLYEDLNGNGKYDEGLDSFPHKQSLLVNNIHIKTNEQGNAQYKNVSPGKYKIDFTNMDNSAGLVPVNGFVQEIAIQKNPPKIYIPLNKGRRIAGNIKLVLDDKSSGKFDIGSLKITATDSAGVSFTTYSDAQGIFTFSLPAGNYKVSLNPDAFDENFRSSSMAVEIDLLNHENQNVAFTIKQKPRKVNKVKAEL
ncbi:MAG: hypothetical protein DI598_05125, partial [Pseudopedobacter saltans]